MFDPSGTMKTAYLSRRLAREKTVCPACNKKMQVGTLAWSHKCRVVKQVPHDVVQDRLDRMRENAIAKFQKRQGRLSTEQPSAAQISTENVETVNADAVCSEPRGNE